MRSQHLPLRFDWATLAISYWIVLAPQSIFAAVLLALIGMPREQILDPFLARFRQNRPRIAVMLIYFAVLAWCLTPISAIVLTVDTLAVLELRARVGKHGLLQSAAAILPPALYFFFGFLLILAYNSVIVSVRYNFAFDPAMAAIDRWLLFGHSVRDFAHWAARSLPPSFLRCMEFVYFGMFLQIGATLLITALNGGRAHALRFIGTILVAYYITLLLFFLWPSHAPYELCPDHFSRFPSNLQAYSIQKTLLAHALARWNHLPLARISTDYFVGFPCMHVTQPLIVLWFLPWRRMRIALAAYDILLVAAIIFLEWHFAVDILGGIVVAGIAIAISGWPRSPSPAEATE